MAVTAASTLPVNARTWLLWYGPWLMLGGGVGVLALIVLRRRRPAGAEASALPGEGDDLTREERERLDQLLKHPTDQSKADR